MPRPPRLHVAGGCYHVILRGNHRESIFSTATDRLVLNAYVAEAIEIYRARVHAFCWMTNHLHALIQVAELPLGLLVKRFATRYSRYRHKQLRTTGHLFERRYKAWLVDVDTYFLALLRYIHRNPMDAGMVSTVEDYPWSSHRAYLGLEDVPWLTTDFGLSLFSARLEVARAQYRSFINDELAVSGDSPSLLVSDDPRVIGTDRFLASLPPPRVKPRSWLSLEQLAHQVCTERQVSVEQLQSRSKHRRVSDARAELAHRAIEGRIASLNQVARFVSRTSAAISQLLSRRTRSDV